MMKFIGFMLCVFVFASCEKQQKLPNGYHLKRRDSGKYEIASPAHVATNGISSSLGLINPDITKIAVIGELVVGFAESIRDVDGLRTSGGYFLLNTNTMTAKEGMTLDELRKILASDYSVYDAPVLKTIHRY